MVGGNKTTEDMQAFIVNLTNVKHEVIVILDSNKPKYNTKEFIHKIRNQSSLINTTTKSTYTQIIPTHIKEHDRLTSSSAAKHCFHI